MISTELSMIQMLNPRRHELALLQEAFLSKGGTIEVIAAPGYVPPPARHEPPPSAKCSKPVKPRSQPIADRLAFVATIRKMAETMTITQAVEATGKCETSMRRAAFEGSFKFVSKVIIPANDLKLIERLSAPRDVGVSRRMACFQVQISPTLICRLEKDYDFIYPKRWTKPVSTSA